MVNKLIREAKLLRKKYGTETQQEKYKRKADKLLAEVHALKTIKDDDISKFGLLNERKINDILQDQSLSNNDRIIARVSQHKSLQERLMQFRDKFPEYKTYFEKKKKKTTKLKNKTTAKGKESLKKSNLHSPKEKSKKREVSDENVVCSQDDSKDEQIDENDAPDVKLNSRKRKKSFNEDNVVMAREKLTKIEEDSTSEDTFAKTQSSVIKPCYVTKEATVKRFAELLEEQESTGDTSVPADPVHVTTASTKLADDFFITGDDQEDCRKDYRIAVSPSYTSKSRKHNNTETSFHQSRDRIKTQSARYKRDGDFDKTRKYDQTRNKFERRNVNENKKYSNKQPVGQEKRASTRISTIDKYNKNNLSDATNKEENASLHPSWLAKKKQQEMMSQGFRGKKIVFAD